jgi:serine/threonine protein kinase
MKDYSKMAEDGKEESELLGEDDEFVMKAEELKIEDKAAFLKQAKKTASADDFEVIAFLGEGSYAKVVQVRQKVTGKILAMKIILKKHVKKVTPQFPSCLVEKGIPG